VAALGPRAIDLLRDGAIAEMLDFYLALRRQVVEDREQISEVLFTAVGGCDDKKDRRALLALRRKLYSISGERGCRSTDIPRALQGAERQLVEAGVAALVALEEARCRVTAEYDGSLVRQREAFRRLIDNEDFRKGVALSSPTLFTNLQRYAEDNPFETAARLEQVERGLLRYFTRASMKATPFGRFCTVVPGTFLPGNSSRGRVNCPTTITGQLDARRTAILPNRKLFRALWTALKKRPGVRMHLRVHLNPTLTEDQLYLRFLCESPTGEVFQTLARTPAIDLIVRIAKLNDELTLRDLAHELHATPTVESSFEDAINFINSLIQIGILRFCSPVTLEDAKR
jgi:hypothetical protein